MRAKEAGLAAGTAAFFALLAAVALAMKATAPAFPGEQTRYFKAFVMAPDLYNNAKAVVLAWGLAAVGLIVLGTLAASGVASLLRMRQTGPAKATSVPSALLASFAPPASVAPLVPLFLLAAWMWVCASRSERPGLASQGFLELFDGLGTQLCYLGVALAAFALERAGTLARGLVAGMAACSLAVAAIGFLQYVGHPPWTWSFAGIDTWLLDAKRGAVRVQPTWGAGSFSATLYNPNWAGAFFALFTPVALSTVLHARGRVAASLAQGWFVVCFASLLATGSRASFFGVCVSLLLLMGSARRAPRKALVSAGFAVTALLLVRGHRGTSMAEDLRSPALRGGLTPVVFQAPPTDVPGRGVHRVESRGQAFILEWREARAIVMEGARGALEVHDDAGRAIPMRWQGNGWRALHPAFHDLSFDALPFDPANPYGTTWEMRLGGAAITVGFTHMGARVRYLGAYVAAETPPAFPAWLPDGFASYRGYIWKRTLPLVAASPVFGYGPGAYADAFPQADVVGKLATLGVDVVVDKPHNALLQQAVSFGVPGLVAYLATLTLAFLGLVRKGAPSDGRGAEKRSAARDCLALGCAAGLVAHVVAGLAVDASVGVAPFLWLVVGFGLSRLGAREVRLEGGVVLDA